VEYETEEQQVEALKAWWAENGKAVIAGVVLGVGIIGGWSFWQGREEKLAVAASDAYSETMSAVTAGEGASVVALADELTDNHGGTLYAAYASLAAARVAVEEGDLETAAARLDWVVDAAPQEDIQLIATVRLARVEGALGKGETALERLPSDYPETFTGLIEEARGDLLAANGDVAAARSAYEKAQASGNVVDANALTMKINELAVAESAS